MLISSHSEQFLLANQFPFHDTFYLVTCCTLGRVKIASILRERCEELDVCVKRVKANLDDVLRVAANN